MSAPASPLADLVALCARRPVWYAAPTTGNPETDGPADPWLPRLDGTARRSAVLVLMGVMDGQLAERTDGPVPADLDVLLIRRSSTLAHHPGQVSFPGGGIDQQDSGPVAAALREATEETGLDPTGVTVLGTLPELPVAVSRNLVTPVIAWWDTPSAVAAGDPAETVDVFRVPVADLVDPANRVTTVVRRPGTAGRSGRADLYRGPAFDVAGTVVWGFTAYVLDRLLHDLGWAQPWDTSREIPAPV